MTMNLLSRPVTKSTHRLFLVLASVLMAGTLSASPVPPAPCLALKGQLVSLETQHKKLVLASESADSAVKQKLASEIMALDKQISETAKQLALCETPPFSMVALGVTPLSIGPISAKGIGAPDPQIAVGHKYFAAIDTSTIVFYDKATMQPLSTGFAYPQNPIGVSQLFQQFFVKLDKQMGLPANVCDSNQPQKNLTSTFDPAQPNKAIPGCIAEAYDTRILYDNVRHRFWIESAVRNRLWPCGAGAETGTSSDPDPSDPTKAKCHADWSASWAHRFIVIAVSQVNDKGEEDLSKPFHQYALVDDYQDWPQMTVNDNYLILNHHWPLGSAWVFNAQALADGWQDNSAMAVQPLLAINYDQLVGFNGTTSVPATDNWYLVRSHGPSNHLTYMVSANANMLLLFALKSPTNELSGKPTLLKGAAIDLGHRLSLVRTNPVFRDGKIYLANSDECKTSDSKNVCIKYVSRIIRVPVSLSSDGSSIHASGPGSPGFLDYIVGGNKNDFRSYVLPALEVNQAGDIVLVYHRFGLDPSHLEPGSAEYGILYHDKSQIYSGILKASQGTKLPADPNSGAIVDLVGTALDPSDALTVWMSHVYSVNGIYREVIGAVKP